MKAIAITQKLPLDHLDCFVEVDLPDPVPGPRDLLVRIQAVSVNPVDYKVRQSRAQEATEPRILGWDACGVVEAIGAEVNLFRPGDEVYYAGDITRAGSNAALQVVDERLVAKKPAILSYGQAAALPLTAITAWEALFERLGIVPWASEEQEGRTLLVIGGAGGVGSIAIQLARRIAGLKVVATASRPESADWCRQMGADHVISHREAFLPQLKEQGVGEVDYIFCCNDTDSHWKGMAEAVRPQGRICSIVENARPLELGLLKSKSVTFVWEFMFTRSMYQTPDMIEQHRLLARVAELIDNGTLVSTCGEILLGLTPANVALAHQRVEAGTMIGKLVIADAGE